MKEKVKVIIKGSLALLLALSMVVSGGVWMKDAQLLADEAAPEAAVVVEEAAPAELPVPAAEPVAVVQEVTLPAEEPAENEPAVRSPEAVEEAAAEPVADAQTQDAEPAEQADSPAEAEQAEEPAEQEAVSAESEAPFDVRAAYEHYMSLSTDAEKRAFLESLDPADRAALEEYIALKEAEAAAAEKQDAEAEADEDKAEDAEVEVTVDEDQQTVEAAVEEAAPAEEEKQDVEADEDKAEDEPDEEEPEDEEPEVEVRKSALLLAYENYLTMTEEEQAEYLEGLTEKERARFEKLAELVEAGSSFTVRFFDYEGNQIGEAQTVIAGASAVAPEAPSKEGEEFTGWNANFSCVLSDLDVYPRVNEEEKEYSVYIWCELLSEGKYDVGAEVGFYSELKGFEDVEELGFEWQCSADGENWEDYSGAAGETFSYVVTEENYNFTWRLIVNGR